jgi:translation initiation factor IF-3
MTTAPPTRRGPRVNELIRAKEVRVIAVDGRQLGTMSLRAALELAREAELDLVEVAPDADPPVCRIMDYGRHRFEQAARQKEGRRRTPSTELKEMRFSIRIGPGDFATKQRKIATFLRDGHRVKVSVRFRRGREQSRPEFGRALLERLVDGLGEQAKVESLPRLDGTFLSMLLAPGRRPETKESKA